MGEGIGIEKRLSRAYSLVRVSSAFISKTLNDLCGPCTIVAVFGPYSDSGRAIIDEIMRFIVLHDLCPITLDGYYHPSEPANQRPIDDLIPALVRMAFRRLQSMYVRILPRVACRVVTNVTDIRTNLIEWDESSNLGKPMFTFLLADIISLGDHRDCEYLHTDDASWVECTAPGSEFCTGRRFCPFDELPWMIRQGTMDHEATSRLIGAQSLDVVKIPLLTFLRSPIA